MRGARSHGCARQGYERIGILGIESRIVPVAADDGA